MLALVTLAVSVGVAPVARAAAGQRLDLRVLVVDDGSAWVGAITQTMTVEGVPFTAVKLADANRPVLTPAFLASGTEGYFQAVVAADETGAGLSPSELAALRGYETGFGVRQVDAFTWANPGVGLNYAANPGYLGSLDTMTATVTASGQAQGFGYLSGSLPIAAGSYGYLAVPLSATSVPALPVGATFTPLVTAPIPGSTSLGSLIGAYTAGGLSQLVITMNYNSGQQHFRMLAHGIISWMTQGIHFGYNRNNFTFHFDDAFGADARWDSVNKCTPGEDCPATVAATPDIRMSAADVAHVVAWEQASGYTPTLAFNGYYSQFDSNEVPWNGTDELTNALVANKAAFKWLNHGYEHIYQGCVQDFTVIPWRCVTSPAGQVPAADGSNLVWASQAAVSSEITQNIAVGQSLGLPFDQSEYLSGEHSGLYLTPQQPVDNPNFAAALSANGIKVIGADASREPSSRVVGGATTIPRHPTAVYYNTSTAAEAADEYNYFYLAAPAGKCVATAVTTCMTTPVNATTGFADYIVPSDAAYDLGFVLSNDPRPFYAHVSNLTAPDYLGLQLIDKILATYKASFAANAPLLNLTETQAADVLAKQTAWASAGMTATPQVTGYLLDGQVTVTNATTTTAAPITVPTGTLVNGAPFGGSYGGESSGWTIGNQTLTVPVLGAPVITSANATTLTAGTTGSFTVTTTSTSGVPTLAEAGALPTGVTFTDNANGTATLAGTPAAGTGGIYALTLTATSATGSITQPFTLTVNAVPAFTGAATATAAVGTVFSFPVTTTGYPAATLTQTGALPAGITFTPNANGTATLAGTATAIGSYPLTLTATNTAGTTTQTFTLNVSTLPGAPTIGTAVAGSTTATVAWTAPTLTGGSPITGYLVRTYTGNATTPSATTVSAPAGGTSVVVSGLTNATSYRFDVAATNALGTSPYSAISNVVTPRNALASVPTNVVATAGNASAVVTWIAPTVTAGITGYRVRAYIGTSTNAARTVNVTASQLTAPVTGLVNGTAYTFDVAAVTVGVGPVSARSAAVTPSLTGQGAAAPTIVSVTPAGASAVVSWQPPVDTTAGTATGYRVRAYLGTGTAVARTVTVTGTATTATVTNLVNGSAYTFDVTVQYATGNGSTSARSAAVTPVASVPGAPVIGTAAPGNAGGAITATALWTPPASNGGSAILGYVVTATGANGSVTTSPQRPAGGRSYSMTLPSVGQYSFTVVAVNAAGNSVRSASSNIVTGQ